MSKITTPPQHFTNFRTVSYSQPLEPELDRQLRRSFYAGMLSMHNAFIDIRNAAKTDHEAQRKLQDYIDVTTAKATDTLAPVPEPLASPSRN